MLFRSPLMLVIEDMHWADRSTLGLVALLVHALRDVRVLLVVTFRSDELHRTHPLRPLVAAWERTRSVRRIELARFSRDETAGQLEAILGARPDPAMLALLHERSEGNAFLSEEILGALQDGTSLDELPRTLRDVLLVRAEQLSPHAQGLLRVTSVAGRSVPDRLLSLVSELDEASLDDALREVVEHHLLVVDDTGEGYRFRHALTRDAVYEDALPRERVRIHRAYGEALSSDPSLAGGEASRAAALALHWSAAHDLPQALCASIEAARLAAVYAPAEALAHYEHGLEFWQSVPDAPQRCGIDLAEALKLAALSAEAAGEHERSLSLYDETLAELDGSDDIERVASVLESKAMVLASLGREERTQVLERAVDMLPADPPSATRAMALTRLLSWRWLDGGDPSEVKEAAEQALAATQAAGAQDQEALARMWLGVSQTYLGDAEAGIEEMRRASELAEEIGEHTLVLRTTANLSDALEEAGRHADSARAAERGLELARRVGLTRHPGNAVLVANRAEALCRLGSWQEADELLSATIDSAPARSPFLAHMFTLRATIAALRGAWEQAAHDIDVAAATGVGGVDAQVVHALELARVLLARGRGEHGHARDLVRDALQVVSETNARYYWPLLWLGVRIEAEASDRQREQVQWLCSLADGLPLSTPSARTYHALALAETHRANSETADWGAAAEAARAEGDPYLQAYALLREADQALATGERDSAARKLVQSARLLAKLGAEPVLAEAQTLARRARIQLPQDAAAAVSVSDNGIGSYGLTERELEVLQLVADGRSNPQIAAALFISRKTASVHVSNIITKLNVTSRGEAAAMAHRLGFAR